MAGIEYYLQIKSQIINTYKSMLCVVIQLHLHIVARLQVMIVKSLGHRGFGCGTYLDDQKNHVYTHSV